MKKILSIIFIFISANTFAQVKVIKVQGQVGISKADSITGYVTPSQLRTKVDTSHKDTLQTVGTVLHVDSISPTLSKLRLNLSTDTTFSNASDDSVSSSLAVKKYVDNHGGSTDTTSLSNRINQKLNNTDTSSMLSPYLKKADATDIYQPKGTYATGTGTANGTNTGDETATTIKSKLGITTLSGSNTGDQDLSGLVPKTTTINGHALSSNVTVSASDLTTGTLPHAQLPALVATDIPNISESQVTNLTTDLAAKQATLVSGTNIKTVGGVSILGSGDIPISGGGTGSNDVDSLGGQPAKYYAMAINKNRQYLGNMDSKLSAISQGNNVASFAFIGDSWTASQGFTKPFTKYMVDNYGNGGYGYNSANTTYFPTSGVTKATTGTWTNGTSLYGIDASYASGANAATYTWTVSQATDIIIYYTKQSGGATFTWTLDGGTAITVNTANTIAETDTVQITGLTSNSHNLVLTITSSGGAIINGIDFRISNVPGVLVHNMSHSGASTATFSGIDYKIWTDALKYSNPDAVVIMLGVNDVSSGTDPATFYARYDTIIKRIKTTLPLASIAIMTPTDLDTSYAYPWESYITQMDTLAEREGCAFLNNYQLFGDSSTIAARGLYSGKVHLTPTGYGIIYENLIGFINTAIKTNNLFAPQKGDNFSPVNIANAIYNFASITTGSKNTAVGLLSSANLTTANYNTAVGYAALNKNVSSSQNTATGYQSLTNLAGGVGFNTAVGFQSLQSLTTGSQNTAYGAYSLNSNSTGTINTAIGYQAGRSNTGSGNTFIGSDAGYGAGAADPTISNAIVIGRDAYATKNSQVMLGKSNIQETFTWGNVIIHKLRPASATTTTTTTLSINSDTTNFQTITALSAGLTINNPSGTPNEGQALTLRIKDNGTPQTITWGTSWRGVNISLPNTTTASQSMYLGFNYNSTDSKWDFTGNITTPSGTYTPTVTPVDNVTSLTLGSATYQKIGNIVTVRITFNLTPTTSSTLCRFNFSLPFTTSNLIQAAVGSGVFAGTDNTMANVINATTVETLVTPSSTNGVDGMVLFQYEL